MNLSDFTIRILLLFLPGIICSIFVDKFTTHKKKTPFYFVIVSFTYGFVSYFSYWLLLKLLSLVFSINSRLYFTSSLLDNSMPISFGEIVWVCITAAVLSYVISFIINRSFHYKIARILSVTNKFAETDVWEFTFNSKDLDEWVTVRDHKYNLIYQGWVNAFSQSSNKPELLLRDVSVYSNETGKPLYQIGCMYIARSREDLTIEFGNIPVTDSLKWKDKKNDRKKEH
ncbi:MAG: DUF6338 family protein [Lentisphaerota bacterium]